MIIKNNASCQHRLISNWGLSGWACVALACKLSARLIRKRPRSPQLLIASSVTGKAIDPNVVGKSLTTSG